MAYAATAGQLDQQYLPASAGGLIVEQAQSLAETFKVSQTGQLDRVALDLARNPVLPTQGLTLGIFRTLADGSPATTSLATFSIAADSVSPLGSPMGNFVQIDLDGSEVDVVAGEKLALVLQCGLTGHGMVDPYAWLGRAPGGYADGKGYVKQQFGWSPTGYDLGFQTYISPTTVPEPSPWALLATGAGALCFLKRRSGR